MFSIKTLRGQGMAATAVSILIFIIVSGTGMLEVYQLSSSIGDINSRVSKRIEHVAPLLSAADDVHLDVVEVQQWLTDISATRGLNGLNDGLDKAAKFAKLFDEDLQKAMIHAKAMNLTDIIDTLGRAKMAFPEYYNIGKAMAKVYVAEGPVGGNKMMASFDAAAEKINIEIDALMKNIEDLERTSAKTMHESSAKAMEKAKIRSYVLLGFSILGLLALLLIGRMTDQIMSIITNISLALDKAQNGDLETRLKCIKHDDERGKIQHNFNRLMDITEAYVREIRAAMVYVGQGKYYRTILEEGMKGNFLNGVRRVNGAVDKMAQKVEDFSAIADKFEIEMKTVVETVTSAATELQATAQAMETTAQTTTVQSKTVASAADLASANVQTVASAAEELSSSISEISRQVSQSSEIASQAVNDAEESSKNVQGLADSASKIGEVVSLISDIADQTNLLALNATIEAARAGDAGKGFAVVASEVKNLANQTAKATEEISQQVGSVQHATEEAVKAIENIGATIGSIDEASTAIASAVEEQGAATQEIARNVEQAATGTNEVTTNIAEVTQGVNETEHAAKEVLTAAEELARQGVVLGDEMDAFLIELRKVI